MKKYLILITVILCSVILFDYFNKSDDVLNASEVEINTNLSVFSDINYLSNDNILYSSDPNNHIVYNNDTYSPEVDYNTPNPVDVFNYSKNKNNAQVKNRHLRDGDSFEIGIMVGNPSKNKNNFMGSTGSATEDLKNIALSLELDDYIKLNNVNNSEVFRLYSNGVELEQLTNNVEYTYDYNNNILTFEIEQINVDEVIYIYIDAQALSNQTSTYEYSVNGNSKLDSDFITKRYDNLAYVDDVYASVSSTDYGVSVTTNFNVDTNYLKKDLFINNYDENKVGYSIFRLKYIDPLIFDEDSISNLKINGVDYNDYLKSFSNIEVETGSNYINLYIKANVSTYEITYDIKFKDNKDDSNIIYDVEFSNQDNKQIYESSFEIEVDGAATNEEVLEVSASVHDTSGDGLASDSEVLKYDIIVKNNSEFDYSNVILNNDLTNNSMIDSNSITNVMVNSITLETNDASNIHFDIEANSSVEISFEIKTHGVSNGELIETTFEIITSTNNYDFKTSIYEINKAYFKTQFNVLSSSGNDSISNGDYLIYELVLTNPTDKDINNLTIIDDFNSSFQLKDKAINNLKVDGVLYIGELTEGIKISLQANSSLTITFEGYLKDDEILNGEQIINYIKIINNDDYSVTYDECSIFEKAQNDSFIRVESEVNDLKGNNNQLVNKNEVLTYTYTIENNSNRNISNVKFKTDLFSNENFKDIDNIKINGKSINSLDNLTLSIKEKSSSVISFDVLYNGSPNSELINNLINIEYGEYTFNNSNSIIEAPSYIMKPAINYHFVLILILIAVLAVSIVYINYKKR